MAFMKDLSGRTALITGGSSGIGLAITRMLSKEGAFVIVLARDKGRSEMATASIKGSKMVIAADVRDPVSLSAVADELRKKGMTIDVLVNSAGIVFPIPLQDQTQQEIEDTIRTNLLGTINSCKYFVPLMRSPGYIANISSIAGIVGLYGYSTYGASKFALVGLSESLSLELHEKGIRVGAVFPPDTDTPQLRQELKKRPEQLRRMVGKGGTLSADKVARSVINGIKSGKARVYPSKKGRFLDLVAGPAGPVVRWYLRRALNG